MENHLLEIFEDSKLVEKIKRRLPYLFQLAELESSRAGKVGMEVGSVRERIIVALLIYKFGDENVEAEIPITEPEVDVILYGSPISIKTITGKNLNGVKLSWTVDESKAKEFQNNYYPKCDVILIHINWNNFGAFYYIPLSVQEKVFREIGRENYIKLPKKGTNPRGTEITKIALSKLIEDDGTKKIEIFWAKQNLKFNAFTRWVELWREENDAS
jgi:hypothetical protein